MNLKEKLRQTANYVSKLTYDELVEMLFEKAKKEEYELYIDGSKVFESDIRKLENEEDLEVKFLEGENYSFHGCWKISWY